MYLALILQRSLVRSLMTLMMVSCLFVVSMPHMMAQSIEQIADPQFDARVSQPVYNKNGPKVLFDEAHQNIHTVNGRYQPFVNLIRNDGYQVVANHRTFQPKTLAGYKLLVIANALGTAEGVPALTNPECDAVRDWVKQGGSLLLIADHHPFGGAVANLANRFGITMSDRFTVDAANHDQQTGIPSFLWFTRGNGLLKQHPINQGRSSKERIDRVLTFTGQSLSIPPESTAFLQLSDTAIDLTQRVEQVTDIAQAAGTSAAHRAQGVALSYGQGRVVVLGEAAVLSAQLLRRSDQPDLLLGMNRLDTDNRQLALNLVHWLSKLLN